MTSTPKLTAEQVPEPVRIGRLFRNLRKARNRTLKDLGAEIGHTHGFLSKVERGAVTEGTQLGLIAPIADAYGIDTSDLIAELYPDGNTPPALHLAIANARKDT